VTGEWTKGHIEGDLDLYSLLNVVQMNRWRGRDGRRMWQIWGRGVNTKGSTRMKVHIKWITNRMQSVEWVQLAPVGTSGMASTVAKLP
jgi:hypothetical protein